MMISKQSLAAAYGKRATLCVLGLLALEVVCLGGCNGTRPLAQPAQVPPAPARAKVVWQLFTDVDYRGPVQRAAVDSSGEVVYLATLATLYRVETGEVEVIGERPTREARLALAPGGKVHAWLMPEPEWQGLFSVRLMDFSGRHLADLRLEEFPHGFSALYLGFEGRLIVTASPLDDWEGLQGRFQVTFWDREGEMLNSVVFPTQQVGFLDPAGTTILLLGEDAAAAFSASGKDLWRLPGKFRKAAIAQDGTIAVLNPASREVIDQVLIYHGSGEPAVITAPTPVHDLIIVPDGSLALVVADQGRYFYLDPRTSEMREGPSLPFEGKFQISDAEFVDYESVALGVLHRVGEPPKHSWPEGSIIVIDQQGNVDFQQKFPIREAIASVPSIDMVFGEQLAVGFTEDTTVFLDLRN